MPILPPDGAARRGRLCAFCYPRRPGHVAANMLASRLDANAESDTVSGSVLGTSPETAQNYIRTLAFSQSAAHGYDPAEVQEALAQLGRYISGLTQELETGRSENRPIRAGNPALPADGGCCGREHRAKPACVLRASPKAASRRSKFYFAKKLSRAGQLTQTRTADATSLFAAGSPGQLLASAPGTSPLAPGPTASAADIWCRALSLAK